MHLRNLILILSLSLLMGQSLAVAKQSMPKCHDVGESCTMLATPAAWPEAISGETLTVAATRYYKIQVPARPTQIISSEQSWFLGIRYEGEKSILMGMNRRGDSALHSTSMPKTLTLADMLRYAYTTRPDKPPTNPVEFKGWYFSVWDRSGYFRSVISAKVFTKGPLTIYYVERSEPLPSHQSAYLVDLRRPNESLTIDFKNFHASEALEIIGSIQIKGVNP